MAKIGFLYFNKGLLYMKSYIITAVKDEAPLLSNQEGEKLLNTKSKKWQNILHSERTSKTAARLW